MSRTSTRLIGSLDAAARRTGIPALATRGGRRRFRWLPAVLLLLGVGLAGYGLLNPAKIALAVPLLVVVQSISVPVHFVGPLRAGAAGGEIVDEFDRDLSLRAWLAGFAGATAVALIGLFGSAGVALLMRWPPIRLVEAVILIPLLMLVVLSTVPTLYASWALPSPGEDD
ncbi:hypothetical protein MZO42_16610 [Sphingomonas psychrotolerans]|uniref:Uncharacterized protein n=1 Tax=Sphingomonas psychrotolerans TaxID=1327635 RepID=A0ABU3NAA0_9SPHN|nr:hypothetical protein [Sphingomonas psychrotolerans]MDT8760325.1 hypothetical protein [Sphingomonas psychrotolerans]